MVEVITFDVFDGASVAGWFELLDLLLESAQVGVQLVELVLLLAMVVVVGEEGVLVVDRLQQLLEVKAKAISNRSGSR